MAVFGSKKAADDFQGKLIARLMAMSADDLAWHTIKLDMGQATSSGWTVEVCSPVFLDGYYVPVTAADAWKLARSFGAFPLTRAVADQAHNYVLANYGSDYAIDFTPISALPRLPGYKDALNPPLHEFQVYWDSSFLKPTKYMTDPNVQEKGVDQGPLVSGSHKLWVLSNWRSDYANDMPRAVNYGFYAKANSGTKQVKLAGRGPYLDRKWYADQTLGNKHNSLHWDYSQLLQLMRNLRIQGQVEPGPKPADMLRSLLKGGNEKLWDEDKKGFDRDLGV
jgi:hypothetical protein